MTDEELMRQALEVLERCPALYKAPKAATALRERLAQPVREPVDSPEKAGAYMDARLWEFIDMAAAWTEAKTDTRTWDHVLVYAPKQLEQDPVAWGVFDGPNLHDVNFTEEDAQEMVRLKGDGSVVKPLYTSPQPQMQPCAGRNCGSTNPNLHSAECFDDYEKATGMNQRKPLPPQSPCEMTQAERKMFRLGWLECEAAHGIKENA